MLIAAKPSTPLKCRITNEVPPYAEYKFDFRRPLVIGIFLRRQGSFLDKIKTQIYCKKKPFAFSWWWSQAITADT